MLTFIFQASMHQSSVSMDRKQANVVPILKKGNCSLCSNLHLLRVTRAYFVFSHMFIPISLYVLCDEQNGFRHARSCETQLLLTVNGFATNLNNHGQTDVILLDFSKAFDKVSHQHLFHKLHHYA